METMFGFLVPLAAFATFAVLCVGLYGLFKGGDFNRSYSNKLMRLRVLFQFITVIAAMAFLYFVKG